MNKLHLKSIVIILLFLTVNVFAQEKSKIDLEKAIQNPIAKMISIPFQNNTDFDIGTYNRTKNTLNFQPVIPFGLGKSVDLITRTIIPIITQPVGADESTTGLGDINLSTFFTAAKPGALIWGIGPVISFPSATDDILGTGKWSAGPSIVMLTQPKGWTIGMTAQNTWSFAGSENREDVNFFYSQIFIVKSLPKGWYINSAPIITSNWKASPGNQWTVPLGIGFGKLFKIGKLTFNGQTGYYNYVVKPDGGAKWQLRAMLILLIPAI